MKKLTILILLIFSVLSISAQNELYEKYAQRKGVEATYISKAMMQTKVMKDADDVLGKNKLIQKLDYLWTIDTESAPLIKEISDDAKKYYSPKYGWQEMIRQSDDKTTMLICQKELKGGKNAFVIVTTDQSRRRSNANVLLLCGKITFEDLAAMKNMK